MFVPFLCVICFFLAYLFKRAGAETTSLAPADLQDDLEETEEVSEAALECRESALPGCSSERAVVRKERSAIQVSACYHRM